MKRYLRDVTQLNWEWWSVVEWTGLDWIGVTRLCLSVSTYAIFFGNQLINFFKSRPGFGRKWMDMELNACRMFKMQPPETPSKKERKDPRMPGNRTSTSPASSLTFSCHACFGTKWVAFTHGTTQTSGPTTRTGRSRPRPMLGTSPHPPAIPAIAHLGTDR